MFITIEASWILFFIFSGLVIFGFYCWRRPVLASAIILLLAPSYLIKIYHWPITLLELFLLVFFVVWAIKKAKETDGFGIFFRSVVDLFGTGFFVAVFLIIFGTLLSTFLSTDWRVGAGILKAWILEPIIFSLILADIIKSRWELEWLVFALCLSATFVAAASLVYRINGWLTFDGRLAGWYLSPNHLAMFLAPGLILAGWGLFVAEKKNQKITWAIAVLFLILALSFTFSYGAWAAILAAMAFVVLSVNKNIERGKNGILLFCLGLGVLFLAIGAWQVGDEKWVNLLAADRSSWQSRLMIWQSTYKILESHWLFGIGPGLFQSYYLDYQKFFPIPYLEWAVPQPHNLFLAWWLAGGILGLAGFLILLVTYFKNFILTKQKQLLQILLAAAFVYLLVHGLVDTPYWKNDLALVFWSIVFLSYKAARRCD